MPRKHPLFPQHHETALNPLLAYSDHLPILTSVSLGEGIEPLNIISLNILGNKHSGVHDKFFDETEEVSKERYDRIAAGLAAGAIRQDASVILLQEASSRMLPSLEGALDPDLWQVIYDEDTRLISLYKRDRMNLQATRAHPDTRVRSMTFQMLQSGKTVDVHNIWGFFRPFPDYMEQLVRDTLTQTESEISVLVGDTNSRIAPLDNRKRNITTGIIPPVGNELDGLALDLQRSDYPDGGFYRDAATGVIKQLETQVLDFVTGEVVVDERSAEEIELWPEYRMIMCLDDSYLEHKAIDGFSVFEYEEELKADLNDPSLLVRMAADSFNNKAVAIRFSLHSPVYTAVHEALEEEEGVQFRTLGEGVPYRCVFVPIEKVELLHNALLPYAPRLYFADKINKQIERLSESHWYFRDVPAKVERLTELRDQLMAAKGCSNQQLLTIIEDWETAPFVDNNADEETQALVTDNKMLMGVHRNIFFSSHRPGVLTSTQTLIQELKDCIQPVTASTEVTI
ncbi:hypothetical protein BN59_03419 [Legionella massiliensis]|uniref:Endonuclease/Exonuclease/phosphatase family protein n=1 Tax=Legionella massiliensis TaxID=1034943 RepID=A0A078L1H5_9GAMM|nr:hypothetical protein [Legionella massiliensis]CDZ79102.1 hypothetical protein BN59_03419 [Legionella massiliensis]CEE14840.1 hypothetical protein BN1094_03419 [Legionella massiliensis]